MLETSQRSMEEALRFFAKRVQPVLVECDEAARTLVFSFEFHNWMCNQGGNIHGGVIAEAISMSVNALAWYYAGRKQNPCISLQLCYPRPGLAGERIYVRATAVHAGKNMAYVSAVAWQKGREDKPFATGTGVHYTAAALEED